MAPVPTDSFCWGKEEGTHVLRFTFALSRLLLKLNWAAPFCPSCWACSTVLPRNREKRSTAGSWAHIEVKSQLPLLVLHACISAKRKPECAAQERALVGHWRLTQHTLADWAVFVQRELKSRYIRLFAVTGSSGVSTRLSRVFRSYV